MRYKIDRHPLVESDFEQIQDFIAPISSVQIARRIVRGINDRIGQLGDYPNVGTVHSDIRPSLRALPAVGKSVVCFTVDDNSRIVRIISVTYAGQDWQRITKERE